MRVRMSNMTMGVRWQKKSLIGINYYLSLERKWILKLVSTCNFVATPYNGLVFNKFTLTLKIIKKKTKMKLIYLISQSNGNVFFTHKMMFLQFVSIYELKLCKLSLGHIASHTQCV